MSANEYLSNGSVNEWKGINVLDIVIFVNNLWFYEVTVLKMLNYAIIVNKNNYK